MTEMLAVMAVAAAEDRALVLGSIQAGLVENSADLVIVVVAEGGDIGADAALRDRARDFIHLEHFGTEAPIPAEAVDHPLPALHGACAADADPLARLLILTRVSLPHLLDHAALCSVLRVRFTLD